jgi:hypothetical protein
MNAKPLIQAPKTTKHLDQMRGIIRGEAEPPAVAKLVGFEFMAIDVGHSVFEMNKAHYENGTEWFSYDRPDHVAMDGCLTFGIRPPSTRAHRALGSVRNFV